MKPDPQIRAADPDLSVFVSANAGSGKTKTLVDRVARLLLQKARPEALLCVTYTKAAAAEMQGRLFRQLGAWAVMPDDRLRAALAELQAVDAAGLDHQHLSDARALFARALETPGGLKIQTIHAFCEKLLRRFPVEAGVSPGFEVADDAGAADLAAEARAAVARQAMEAPRATLADAYDRFSVALAFDDFEQMFRTFEVRRGDLAAWIRSLTQPLPAVIAALVGLDRMEDAEALEREAVSPPGVDLDEWMAAADLLAQGGKTDQDCAVRLREAVAAARREAWPDAVAFARKAFFTDAGLPRKLPTQKAPPATRSFVDRMQARLSSALERARAARIAWDTLYAMTLAGAYVEAYEAAKTRARVLDFADLVQKTRDLLKAREDAAWVLYKLDEGIDHVLVDEAQDTAPEQWEMLRAITGDFFSGAGAERRREGPPGPERSVFVVGDEKQSIFSFQGAQPERLRVEAAHYAKRVLRPDGWAEVELGMSWRSTPEVLGFVDAVFAPEEVRAGLLPKAVAGAIEHFAQRREHQGCVDLWPLEREEPAEERDAWTEPVDARAPGAWKRLAEKVAREIRGLVRRGDLVHRRRDGKDVWEPAGPGDVLVLVKKRGPMFEETIRALKRFGVPAAGADRLNLSEHPVFEDAVALARFILFPDDDLTLAGVLRSPFCDVDEESLFDLAHGRKGSLWAALNARAGERTDWASALAFLEAARVYAAGRPPFDFFSRLYARLDGEGRSQRARLATRLGPEAGDALDEFLAQIEAAERRGVRELEGLAHGLSRLDVVVKREMDEPRGEVRVMTAHGAKGLEAPIVILPETVHSQEPRGSPLLELEGGGFLWCGSSKKDCAASAAARELRKRKAEDEALRLLYVALTRARDRVVLAGRAKQPRKDGTDNLKGWYPLVEAAFDRPEIASRVKLRVENGVEFRRFGHDPARGGEAGATASGASPLPDWASRPAPAEPRALRWASPSEIADRARAAAPSPLAGSGGLGRFRRGELIHKLFEILPDLSEGDRRDAAAAYLTRQPDLAYDQQQEIAASVFAVLEDARFAQVFGEGSRAEVAVAGAAAGLPAGLAIAGRIDRLVVTPRRVLVVDYKSNRPAPARIEDADPAYLGQMAAYRAVLRALYPDRPVEAALLWTDGPKLTPIADEILDGALKAMAGG